MKTTLLASALTAALISCAAAQDLSSEPKASLDPEPARATNLASPSYSVPGPPKYCKPCLFYAGDFDSNASDANGLPNEVDIIVSTGAATYTPFIVPKGKTWTVSGLFTDNFLSAKVLDPARSPYEIRKGIPRAGGSGGTLVCHGRKPATLTSTPANWFGYYIFVTRVRQIKDCHLPSGKYWVSVVPYCGNPNNPSCTNDYRGFTANDDGAMAHRFGPLEPANNSFFNSEFYGAKWEPSSEQQSSQRFSVGVEGTEK